MPRTLMEGTLEKIVLLIQHAVLAVVSPVRMKESAIQVSNRPPSTTTNAHHHHYNHHHPWSLTNHHTTTTYVLHDTVLVRPGGGYVAVCTRSVRSGRKGVRTPSTCFTRLVLVFMNAPVRISTPNKGFLSLLAHRINATPLSNPLFFSPSASKGARKHA